MGNEFVEVTYSAGLKTANESRSVYVTFEEPEAPQIELVVTARVRPPMECSPSEISIQAVRNHPQTMKRSIVVRNFGKDRWDGVITSGGTEWLTITSREFPIEGTKGQDGDPIQAFRLDLEANPAALPSKPSSTLINVEGIGVPEATGKVLVQCQVEPVAKLIPGDLYFGECHAGETKSARVQVIFSSEIALEAPLEVQIPSSLRECLQTSWIQKSARVWQLRAELRVPDESTVSFDNPLTVSSPDLRDELVLVPIKALILPSQYNAGKVPADE